MSFLQRKETVRIGNVPFQNVVDDLLGSGPIAQHCLTLLLYIAVVGKAILETRTILVVNREEGHLSPVSLRSNVEHGLPQSQRPHFHLENDVRHDCVFCCFTKLQELVIRDCLVSIKLEGKDVVVISVFERGNVQTARP